IEEVYGLDTRARQYYETQFEILKSRPLAERVIDRLVLTEHQTFKPKQGSWLASVNLSALVALMPFNIPGAASDNTPSTDPVIDATKSYMGDLSVAPVRKTQLVHVRFESADPKLAAAIANAHADAYIESMMDARVDMSQSASSWMTRRLDDLKLALAESEQKLQAFREREKLVDLEGLQSLPAKEINDLSSRLIEVRRELSQAKTAYFQVRQLSDAPVSALSAVPAVLNDALVQRFREASADAESKVAELGKRYGPKHPKMIAAQSELTAANASLAQQIGRVSGSIKTQYDDAQSQERELVRALERAKNQYHDIGRKETDFRSLQQAVESNRQLYDMFYNRIQETAQTDDLQTANARVISPAITPSEPIKPRKKQIVMLAFTLSVMLGISAAFMLEALNNTVKSAEDIEEKIKQAMLGMLPLVKLKNKKASTGHLFFDPKQQGFAESVRTVRTSLSLSSLDTAHKTILVTSSVSGEGKSTTALNLAYAFGQV
ncbi:MAG: hypothetical protein HKO07_07875, partial [Pseudomonadales bacterium]|nr:hypothetical protein [Pseudomonadales bacterium]